ncbi:pyridoxal-5'-phosphate-dependent enzyme, beta subunit [Chytriomyces cf. hyalinus JEL632]|nr:pyridoxal-5'-phosphate-dependent enzyme, beta subunit [Chytriomyces cf. hyalinus JEL632]
MQRNYAIGIQEIHDARSRIYPSAHETPVMTSATLSALASKGASQPRKLFFKCENTQRIGAFKFRGAFNAVAALSDAERERGVVTHSSGNHAQALALAARMHNVKATIIMPRTAPKAKAAAVAEYGATIVFCEPTQKARDEGAARVMAETGAVFVHPFENPFVMAGQGTLMLELLSQTSTLQNSEDIIASGAKSVLDAVLIPVGGGGMVSGCSIAARAVKPDMRIFGVEPVNVNDCARSLASGVRVTNHILQPVQSIADGLLTTIGAPNWEIIRDHVENTFTVTEDEIVAAMRIVYERMKIVIEPSAAVGVAVALYNNDFKALQGITNVGIVLSGGNLDLDKPLPWVKAARL